MHGAPRKLGRISALRTFPHFSISTFLHLCNDIYISTRFCISALPYLYVYPCCGAWVPRAGSGTCEGKITITLVAPKH